MKNYLVAIDGPAASGKSTTARRVAQHFGWMYVDTGAMYRAVALAVLRSGISADDESGVGAISDGCLIEFVIAADGQRVRLNGEDVTDAIRGADVTSTVSKVSSFPRVRRRMVALQRAFAQQGSLVMDGRDIGTVVFPEADLKFFLIASLAERSRRRAAELAQRGAPVDVAAIEEQIAARDRFDAAREHSPLRKAEDAIELDTTKLTIDDQVKIIIDHVLAVIARDPQQ